MSKACESMNSSKVNCKSFVVDYKLCYTFSIPYSYTTHVYNHDSDGPQNLVTSKGSLPLPVRLSTRLLTRMEKKKKNNDTNIRHPVSGTSEFSPVSHRPRQSSDSSTSPHSILSYRDTLFHGVQHNFRKCCRNDHFRGWMADH